MKEKMKIVAIAIILITVCSALYFYINYKMDLLQFGIITTKEKDNNKYYLYSDRNKLYYLKGYNPSDVFVAISNKNKINKFILKDVNNAFKEGENHVSYPGDHVVSIINLFYAVNNLQPTINELRKKLEIIEEKKEYFNYELSNVVSSDNKEEMLYFEDRFGIKIYVEGISNIFVKYNNEEFELKDILEKNNSISDDFFNSLRYDKESLAGGSEYLSPIVESIYKENIELDKIVDDNKLYYKLKYKNLSMNDWFNVK